jgi:hypothetical protein
LIKNIFTNKRQNGCLQTGLILVKLVFTLKGIIRYILYKINNISLYYIKTSTSVMCGVGGIPRDNTPGKPLQRG